jgi:hypothetical protein
LIWDRGGIEIFVPVDKPGDLKGCTMTINVLDLVKGQTARLFRYTNLVLKKGRDRDPDGNEDKGTGITCESRVNTVSGVKGGIADIRERRTSDVYLAFQYQGRLGRRRW